MKRSVFAVSMLVACLTGWSGYAVSDISSLRGVPEIPVTNDAPQIAKVINDKENVVRTFKEQPPVVPHTVDRYTINLTTNGCLECHMKQPGKDEAKSVEMSESHFVNRDGKTLDHPSAARHFCNQCHVPQVDAQPLIGSTFRAASN